MKKIIVFALLLVSFSSNACQSPYFKSDVRVIESADNLENTYKIFIYVPDTEPPSAGYPVVYMLDGNSIFGSLVDEIRRNIAVGQGEPAIAVAIGYPEDSTWNKRRNYDLTPSIMNATNSSNDTPTNDKSTGGADKFLSLIKNQIIPTIEKHYNIDKNRRTLAGHSFGGLFTLHAFFSEPTLFHNFVAASPSLWYGDNMIFHLLEQHQRQPENPLTTTPRVRLLVGGCEETKNIMGTEPETNDWVLNTGRMVSNAVDFNQRLQKLIGDRVSFRIITGEDHYSVIGNYITEAASITMSIEKPKNTYPRSLQSPTDNLCTQQ